MSGESKRLLWVDDEIEFLRAHILFLEEHGYVVDKATNGDDALELLRQAPYDLVLLDEQMPGKDGLTTLEEIRELDNSIPVVMVTKSEEEKLMDEAYGRNISGYLIKPVNPSQILSTCKRLLHSRAIRNTHITSNYVREYSENKSDLLATVNPAKWEKLHFRLSRWDANLETLREQGLEGTHETQKKETAQQFAKYVENNYVSWFSKKGGNPSLCMNSLKRKVFPILERREKVALLVMSGFRADQWLSVQALLEPWFKVENAMAWSLLPTEKSITRSALFSGQIPREIALKYPELWKRMSSGEEMEACERDLLQLNLKRNGFESASMSLAHLSNSEESRRFLDRITSTDNTDLVCIVVEFMHALGQLRRENPLMMEMVPDEKGFREMARLWLQSSNLLKALKHFAAKGRKVVLTSDHGTILVTQPAEVFCQEEKTPNPRVKIGKDISCDERHALFVETPINYGLPGEVGETGYAIAKEHLYFVYPNKFQYFGTQYKDQMVSGGLSIEEMLVPLVTLVPKGS